MGKQGENNKSNILSMESLKEKHKKSFKMSEAHVNLQGEEFSYKLYDKFPESLQNEFHQEFAEFTIKLAVDKDYQSLGNALSIFTLVLLIDKFTDIEVPQDDKERIIFAEYLTDFGLLSKIINSFEEEEVAKVLEEGRAIAESRTKEMTELLEQYEEQSKNIDELGTLRMVENDIQAKED